MFDISSCEIGTYIKFIYQENLYEGIYVQKVDDLFGEINYKILCKQLNDSDDTACYISLVLKKEALIDAEEIINLHFFTFQEFIDMMLNMKMVEVLGFANEIDWVNVCAHHLFLLVKGRIMHIITPCNTTIFYDGSLRYIYAENISWEKFINIIDKDILVFSEKHFLCYPYPVNEKNFSKFSFTTEKYIKGINGVALGDFLIFDTMDEKYNFKNETGIVLVNNYWEES